MNAHSEPSSKSIAMIRKLVSYDTTSRESNLAIIEFIKSYLEQFGIESMLVYNEDRQKANLYATIGPQDRGGVLLSGHTDVVPIDGQKWTSEPFAVTEKGGRLYGRGTADMKSFVAVALAFAPEFAARNLQRPIHFSFSYDEEVGCVGVRGLIDIVKTMPNKPVMCIVGEPTEMKVVVAHKGKYYMRAHVRGKEGHSSLSPLGVNAIEYAADLISYMRTIGRRKAEQGPFDHEFDIPYSTIMTGIIHGGTNLNIVPNHCWFDFEIRDLPQDDPERLLEEIKTYARTVLKPQMHAIDKNTGIEFEAVSLRPSLDTRPEEDVVTFVKSLVGKNSHGKVAFGTEAALFQRQGGIPTVVCGPGSIEQAHKPDEYVSLEQVGQCELFMRRLADRLASI